jgi:hypothetical protein
VYSVLEPCIAAEEQRPGTDASGLRSRVPKQTAADASSAQVRRNRHFGDLIDSIPHRHQRDASYGFSAGMGHEDMSTLQKISRSLASSVKYRVIHSSFSVRNAAVTSPGASEQISIVLGESTGAVERVVSIDLLCK